MFYNLLLCKVGFWRATLPLALPPCSSVQGRGVGLPSSPGSTCNRKPPLAHSHPPKSKSALLSRKNHQSRPISQPESSEQQNILARLTADELLRRAENEEFGQDKNPLKKPISTIPPSPVNRALLLQLPGWHAFCEKTAKSAYQPSASARRRFSVTDAHQRAANRPAGVPARRMST